MYRKFIRCHLYIVDCKLPIATSRIHEMFRNDGHGAVENRSHGHLLD